MHSLLVFSSDVPPSPIPGIPSDYVDMFISENSSMLGTGMESVPMMENSGGATLSCENEQHTLSNGIIFTHALNQVSCTVIIVELLRSNPLRSRQLSSLQ